MKHYTIKRRGQPWAGIDVFACKYCPFSTHLEYRFDLHMQAFHPEKLKEVVVSLSDLKHSELVELAREKGLPIYGTKQEIIDRLTQPAQSAESNDVDEVTVE